MKSKIFAIPALLFLLSSCEDKIVQDLTVTAVADRQIPEYQRPVVHVSRSEATDLFIPCQAIIDGEVVTKLNAAGTTLLNMPSQDIRLPRLAPGRHEIELVLGRARELYRDAEAACGERQKSVKLEVEVVSSSNRVLALSFPETDVDCYLFMPDEGIAVNCNDNSEYPIGKITVLPAIYTVASYPFSSQKDGFELSSVGDRLYVTKIENKTGNGIDITMDGPLEAGNANSRFCLKAGGYDYQIQVMN